MVHVRRSQPHCSGDKKAIASENSHGKITGNIPTVRKCVQWRYVASHLLVFNSYYIVQ